MRWSSLFALVALVLWTPSTALAQQPGPRGFAFGLSGVGYLFEASDGVFTDPSDHHPTNFGFRLTRAYFGGRSWGWMLDGELYLGVANRQLLDVDMPNTIFGLHAFVGPVVALGPIQTYAAIGLNRTTVGESEIVEVPGLVVIQWIGTGGVSSLWAASMNARYQAAQNAGSPTVIASVPRYSDVSPAGLLGIAYDFGGRALGFRISFDYIPVFMDPMRNNFRATLSIGG